MKNTQERRIQIAEALSEEVVALIQDLPLADNFPQLWALSRQPERLRLPIARMIAEGKARTVGAAVRQLSAAVQVIDQVVVLEWLSRVVKGIDLAPGEQFTQDEPDNILPMAEQRGFIRKAAQPDESWHACYEVTSLGWAALRWGSAKVA